LKEGGAVFDKLQVKTVFDHERGLVSTDKILKDEIVLFVPLDQVISLQKCCQESQLADKVFNCHSTKYFETACWATYLLE
jgi:hypothetical protein